MTFLNRSAQWCLRWYRRVVSPMMPPSCRFVPSCSEYAMEALERHGVMRGGARAVWRVLRCNPLNFWLERGHTTFDPVPAGDPSGADGAGVPLYREAGQRP